MSVEKIEARGWVFYVDTEKEPSLHTPYVGKWMYFFDAAGSSFADEICKKAVESGVVAEAKRTDDRMLPIQGTGVCCFYCNGNDIAAHKKVIAFFLENDLVRRTKSGKLYNISFKLDAQTIAGQYQDDFKAAVKLADFVDLITGKWLR